MEQEMKQQAVESYLKLCNDIKAKTGDERTAMAILQEVNKDVRMAQIRAERENGNGNGNGNSDNQPASPRQKSYLKRLGVEIPAGLNKKRASELIDEALEKESGQDSFNAAADYIGTPFWSAPANWKPGWNENVFPVQLTGGAVSRRWT